MKRARGARLPASSPKAALTSPQTRSSEPTLGKSILFFSTNPERLESLISELETLPFTTVSRSKDGFAFLSPGLSLCFLVVKSPVRALAELHRHYFNMVILDLRPSPGQKAARGAFDRGLEFLDAMDQEEDVELRYGFRRVLALVAGRDSREVDETIRSLGARGVGGVVREPFPCELTPGGEQARFPAILLDEIKTRTAPHGFGTTALCAAGGGTTGIYFELGVLKCLGDCLPPGALHSFDMLFGISAGAVVTGVLANGYTIEEFMAAVDGVTGGRISPMSLSLLQVEHLNLGSLLSPFKTLAQRVRETLLPNGTGDSMEALLLGYSDMFSAPFKASGFERVLREMFSKPGTTNSFRRLRNRLYIGATEQDARAHVLFGDPPNDELPISRAIEASISINPVFQSTEIGGRYFCDGAITRTSNFTEAIRRGATLIFAIDPFVPYVSKRPGYAHNRGALYNVDQDIRTVTYTRFELTRYWALRQHPEVSFYTFLPANRLRRVMSVNPMDHRPYLTIWKGAYLSTLQRILHLRHRMSGDLAARGLHLDTARAEEVAKRLEGTRELSFQDFFPDGRPVLRTANRVSPRVVTRPLPALESGAA